MLQATVSRKIVRYISAVLGISSQKGVPFLYTTPIQKIIYLTLAENDPDLLRQTYNMVYYNGPRSEDIVYCIHAMEQKKWLKTRKGPHGILYGLDNCPVVCTEEKKQVAPVVDRLLAVAGEQVWNNRWIANLTRVHYLAQQFPGDNLHRRAKLIGWKLTEEEIEDFLTVLRDTGFCPDVARIC